MKPHLVRVRADTEDEGSHCFRWRTGDLTFTPDVLQTGRKPILLHCFAVCLHRLHGNPFLPPDVIYFSVFFKSGPYLSRCCHNLPVSAASVPHVNSLRQFQPQNKTSPLMQGSQSVWNVTPSSILAASQPFDFSLNSNFHVSLGFFFHSQIQTRGFISRCCTAWCFSNQFCAQFLFENPSECIWNKCEMTRPASPLLSDRKRFLTWRSSDYYTRLAEEESL